ncbi:MAG: AEC family transporter [Erysipelotrichaceae bacterium]|nr:AEC family transporter [Erysipelotrichaceae bacterium]MDD3810256.1 AEC family transporter [Erysipelotrichaceae bacterium]
MENLIFALNATIPVFIVIVIGYGLRRLGIIDEGFIPPANRFNFKISLPLLLFMQMWRTDLKATFDFTFVGYCAVATTVMFFGIWFFAKKMIRDKGAVGAFVQASYRSSAAVLGIALILNMYNDASMAPMMIIGAVPLFNVYAILVLAVEGNRNLRIKETLFHVFTNPIIVAIVGGSIASLFQLRMPEMVQSAADMIARTATPLALLTIGGAFKGTQAIAKIKLSLIASLLKLVVVPAIFLGGALLFDFSGAMMVALVVLFGGPATPTCYVMADQLGNDQVLSGSVIVITTIFSAVTLTFWIFLLRTIGAL